MTFFRSERISERITCITDVAGTHFFLVEGDSSAALIEQMKQEGKAILMISEELSELIGMADRIIIMKDFEVSREFTRSADLKQTDIIEYMI